MLKVGENSYITVREADELIDRLCPLDSATAYWDALEDSQKESFLIESCREIELTPKQGVKMHVWQTLEFPRRSTFYWPYDDYYKIPDEVKEAQAVNALTLMRMQLGEIRDGTRLSSAKAEKILHRWICGGF